MNEGGVGGAFGSRPPVHRRAPAAHGARRGRTPHRGHRRDSRAGFCCARGANSRPATSPSRSPTPPPAGEPLIDRAEDGTSAFCRSVDRPGVRRATPIAARPPRRPRTGDRPPRRPRPVRRPLYVRCGAGPPRRWSGDPPTGATPDCRWASSPSSARLNSPITPRHLSVKTSPGGRRRPGTPPGSFARRLGHEPGAGAAPLPLVPCTSRAGPLDVLFVLTSDGAMSFDRRMVVLACQTPVRRPDSPCPSPRGRPRIRSGGRRWPCRALASPPVARYPDADAGQKPRAWQS